jgi:TRAP-type mannitol/chloroaromatic compound transport system substrate-binding protein
MTERRRFLVTASGALATAAAAAIVDAPNVIAQPKVQWRMSTTWTPSLDVHQGSAQRLARIVDEMSGGRFRIEVFPGGQIMPPFACFEAAAQGTIEAFMGAAYYWTAKDPAVEWFTTVPFGMNAEGMGAWYSHGDGLKLWEETYAAFNLVPRPGPGIAPQMAGWFRKKISTIADYRGLKMRIPSLGGKVIASAGATAVLTPAAEIYAALERGVIDAAEWVGPHDDMTLGLHRTARYYYYPGWHEPGTTTEFGFNKKAYEALPADLQRMLDHAVGVVDVYGHRDHHAKNAIALDRLKREFTGKVEVLPLPAAVVRDFRKRAGEVVKAESEKSPMARKVSASFARFQALVGPWDQVAESAYQTSVRG